MTWLCCALFGTQTTHCLLSPSLSLSFALSYHLTHIMYLHHHMLSIPDISTLYTYL